MSIPRLPQFRPGTLRLTAALFAVVAQIAVVGAGLSLSREEASAAPHVERSGIALHHAHNEATCIACRVLSIHGNLQAQARAPGLVIAAVVAPPSLPARRAESPTLLGNLSRAPPGIA